MQFETQKTALQKIGEKLGKAFAFFIFSFVAFFIIAKAGATCWSLKRYLLFALALGIIFFVLDNMIRGLSGREKNKIVS